MRYINIKAYEKEGKGCLHGPDTVVLRHILRFVDVAFHEVRPLMRLGQPLEERRDHFTGAAPGSESK